MPHATLETSNSASLREDYFAEVFPNPGYLLEAGEEEHWINEDSFELFLSYHLAKSFKPVVQDSDLELVKEASPDEIQSYRKFILPHWLSRLSYFNLQNAEQWVSPTHFAAYLEHVYPRETQPVSQADDDGAFAEMAQKSTPTQFVLPSFTMSRPLVMSFPTPNPFITEFCIFPNYQLFLTIYFRDPKNYATLSFLKFYHTHQPTYSVLSDSYFAREHIVRGSEESYLRISKVAKEPQLPVEAYDPDAYQRHLEIGGTFALAEFRERTRRGLSLGLE